MFQARIGKGYKDIGMYNTVTEGTAYILCDIRDKSVVEKGDWAVLEEMERHSHDVAFLDIDKMEMKNMPLSDSCFYRTAVRAKNGDGFSDEREFGAVIGKKDIPNFLLHLQYLAISNLSVCPMVKSKDKPISLVENYEDPSCLYTVYLREVRFFNIGGDEYLVTNQYSHPLAWRTIMDIN